MSLCARQVNLLLAGVALVKALAGYDRLHEAVSRIAVVIEPRRLVSAKDRGQRRTDRLGKDQSEPRRAVHETCARGQRRQGLELQLAGMALRIGLDVGPYRPFLAAFQIGHADDEETVANAAQQLGVSGVVGIA